MPGKIGEANGSRDHSRIQSSGKQSISHRVICLMTDDSTKHGLTHIISSPSLHLQQIKSKLLG
eukprot:scaffold238307_cov32-Prasinocladus_malaysianus.AAC.1